MTPIKNGATSSDWARFTLTLGLTGDLLPIVCDSSLEISPTSKLKTVGKVPSRLDRDGKVVGFPEWPSYVATDDDVDTWAKRGYGFCVQARKVRAFDIDIDDAAIAKRVARLIEEEAGCTFPVRFRENSGKCLLGFYLEGEQQKRIIRTRHGNIEFLANGQQFVACGMHTSGVRYQWDWKDLADFPTLTADHLENITKRIAVTFNVEDTKISPNTTRKREKHIEKEDLVVEHLTVLAEGKNGELAIECPFASEHSSDTGVFQTVYFPEGTNGYQHGHFKCLHASCQGRSDQDFLDALKIEVCHPETATLASTYTNDEGEEETFDGSPLESRIELELGFSFDKKGIISNLSNTYKAVSSPKFSGLHLRYDTFKDEVLFRPEGSDELAWRPFGDHEYTRLRLALADKGLDSVGREMIRDCVGLVAQDKAFDSAILWLESLKWDGVKRIDTFLQDYTDAATPERNNAPEYIAACNRYIWTALAGRCLVPGLKVDMAPVFVGPQGAGKTMFIQSMAPASEFFSEIKFGGPEVDITRKLRGCLVAEFSEMAGLTPKNLPAIKGFMSRQEEEWTPKYKEFVSRFKRRVVFFGNTNHDEFLIDETGDRRWLPIWTHVCDHEGVAKVREQLWAEARELFNKEGLLYADAEALSSEGRKRGAVTDAWQDAVMEWLYQPADELVASKRSNLDTYPFRLIDIARGAMGFDARNFGNREESRLIRALTRLGFKKDDVGGGVRMWFPPENLRPKRDARNVDDLI